MTSPEALQKPQNNMSSVTGGILVSPANNITAYEDSLAPGSLGPFDPTVAPTAISLGDTVGTMSQVVSQESQESGESGRVG
jgi:hypothetical protein